MAYNDKNGGRGVKKYPADKNFSPKGDRPYKEGKPSEQRSDRPFGDKKPYEKKTYGDKKPYEKKSFDKPYGDKPRADRAHGEYKTFEKKQYDRDLRDDDRDEDGNTPDPEAEGLVIGRNAVRELLRSDRTVDKLLVRRGDREGSIVALVAEAVEKNIPIVEVDKAKLDSLAGFVPHQGVIAMVAQKDYCTVEDILAIASERGEGATQGHRTGGPEVLILRQTGHLLGRNQGLLHHLTAKAKAVWGRGRLCRPSEQQQDKNEM